jgi:hypothetical protein
MASKRVVVRSNKHNSGGATIATIEEGTKRNGKTKNGDDKSEKTKAEKVAATVAKLAKMKCYNY